METYSPAAQLHPHAGAPAVLQSFDIDGLHAEVNNIQSGVTAAVQRVGEVADRLIGRNPPSATLMTAEPDEPYSLADKLQYLSGTLVDLHSQISRLTP